MFVIQIVFVVQTFMALNMNFKKQIRIILNYIVLI